MSAAWRAGSLLAPVLLLGVLATSAPAATEPGDGEQRVLVWKRKDHALDELPRKLTDGARAAVENWTPFAEAQGYDLGLTGDCRVLILHRLAPTQAARQLRTVESVTELFDDQLPQPPPPPPPPRGAVVEKPKALPEDPETAPVDIDMIGNAASTTWYGAWGPGTRPDEDATIVLIEAASAEQYALVLAHLLQLAPQLEPWKERVALQRSFTLEAPLTGGWILPEEDAPAWDARAELIHRLSELLVTQRFGWQPYWARQGWAWHAEWELTREVWCFPGRDVPVPDAEHGAWKKEIRRLVQARERPVGIADITALSRDTWDGTAARYAWATYRVLSTKHARAMSEVLGEFNTTWDAENRIDHGGGNWGRDPAYELPVEAQHDALRRHTDRHLLQALQKAFLKF